MLISLTGPSGIGKGFIKGKISENYPNMEELVWLTNRSLRDYEHVGKSNRKSVSTEHFDLLVQEGQLVLVQDKLYGHKYGLYKDDLFSDASLRITELHPDNVHQALQINSGIFTIAFVTDDFSFLSDRLSNVRKTETKNEIKIRVKAAKKEVESILHNKHLFSAIFRVDPSTESTIVEQVLSVIQFHLNKNGFLP